MDSHAKDGHPAGTFESDMGGEKQGFGGLHVAAFENRRGAEMARLIERHGGVAQVAPAMREVPLADSRSLVDFANQLLTGQIDIVIFMTGVGFRYLLGQLERKVDRRRFLEALSDIVTVARGPKPVAAMQQEGLTPTIRVPAPNTWREILTTLDAQVPLANQRVAIQEYGETNPSLIAGLEARGATVVCLKVYDWDLPEDCVPLQANIQAIVAGQVEVVLFTAARQVVHVLKMAEQIGLADSLREALARVIVGSIGPTTSETLRNHGFSVDVEPEHGKMGHLVQVAAAQATRLATGQRPGATVVEQPDEPDQTFPQAAWYDSPFMKACRREPVSHTPVWLMRQAGRYMAEYREVRAKTTFLELCKNPQLCSEVMCTAVERLGVDAAIIFSDLLPILEPMGIDLEFAQGEGPVIHNPVREANDVKRVLELEDMDALGFVMETVKQTRADLPEGMPLIGFSGAPFTLASYAIEGGASRNYLHTKALMYRERAAWDDLMGRLTRAVIGYANAQIAAGAQVIQLFDSWVGCLGTGDYRTYIQPFMQQIVAAISPGVPVISFATGNPALLPLLAESGATVVGIDWRIQLDAAWQLVGHDRAVQGNLDPLVLLADREMIWRRTEEVLNQAAGRPGHIFNLGHGVLQQTPVENAIALVEAVHELSRR